MLVAAFQIHVRLALVIAMQLAAAHQDRTRRGPRINPHIESVIRLRQEGLGALPALAARCPKFSSLLLEPDVRSVLLDQIGDVANNSRVQNRLAFRVVERRDGHAPGALARDAPVRPRFDRRLDTIFAPIRDPIHRIDRREGFRRKFWWSMLMNHWSIARKITGVLLRQQNG